MRLFTFENVEVVLPALGTLSISGYRVLEANRLFSGEGDDFSIIGIKKVACRQVVGYMVTVEVR